jgi:hypothetical protein
MCSFIGSRTVGNMWTYWLSVRIYPYDNYFINMCSIEK